ncbi:MAG: outer membrane beta-barrel protein, partial [Flavobacteriaceae bacterium]|nr:outer membrane beta-barrel protein [Flavobacteriaceae bacterium]
VTGRVVDDKGAPISFVTALLFNEEGSEAIAGTSTDDFGHFSFENLSDATYRLSVSMVGYGTSVSVFQLSSNKNLGELKLQTAVEELAETTVTAEKPTIEKSAGKLIFNVQNTSLASGSVTNLLLKTPGVVVIDDIKIRNRSTTVYINNRRLYLSPSQVMSFLTNMDASLVKSVEVITNPPAQYDAEGGSVLNIITVKPISVGYKASVNGGYQIGIKPKYSLGTTQFYKNDWLDFYGNYTVNRRLEYKNQDDRIQFFDRGVVDDVWITDFNRDTRFYSHQANIISEIKLSKKEAINLSANLFYVPNKEFDNHSRTEIFNSASQLDSTFRTQSDLSNQQHNLTFRGEYKATLNENNSVLTAAGSYISYMQDQDQNVSTDYFLPNGDFIRNNAFQTLSLQNTDILIGELDFAHPIEAGSFTSGVKYSNIETDSGLDYFSTNQNQGVFIEDLSDSFLYQESIYAAYVNFSKQWSKWKMVLGLRGEYTDVKGTSRSLGQVNTQEYMEWFPTASFEHTLEDGNSVGLSFVRRITRPRYQSLNPFKYFLNDFNFNGGNPNLVPGINNRVTFSYTIANKIFFELYYEKQKNTLSTLSFQDNVNKNIRNIESNLIEDLQYSLDMVYSESITSWWYFSTYNSLFYLQNEFFAEESVREIYQNKTWGLYHQLYSNLKLSKDRTLSADLTSVYFSNYIYGSYDMGERYSLSIGLRKSFWDNQANVSVGVDDIFNTNNIIVVSKYYNQDNSYFPKPESRLFRFTFKYNFGNTRLNDRRRNRTIKEAERLD